MPARMHRWATSRQACRTWSIAVCVLLAATGSASAQFFNIGGVSIDADGMLREAALLAPDERLERLRSESIGTATPDVAAASPLRKVSLRRLEERVRQWHSLGQPLPADVRHLAGLTQVRYVFFDPAAGDAILAGPAEGWNVAASGEVVGVHSGRPVLHLEDLIAALRFAFAENPEAPFIGCSIDPTAEGLKSYASFMRRLDGIDRARIPQTFAAMEQALGPHAIRLFGIEGSSRAAAVLAAADYRLKRIALGHDPAPVREVVNYLDLSLRRFNRRAAQKQHRWWFVGHYEAVYHTPDELAFELVGQALQVRTARTFPGSADEAHGDAGTADKHPPAPAAVDFAESLTRHFAEVARKLPVFLELQNLVGLATAAELIAQQHGESWRPRHFLDGAACPTAHWHVPQAVPSLANYRLVQGRHWLISVSGGVEINPRELAGRRFRREAPGPELAELRTTHGSPAGSDRWWWD
jgi:Protein of unknown function (DUF1598)